MNTTWMNWGLSFFVTCAMTSMIGAASYFWIRFAYAKIHYFVESFSLPCALLMFLFLVPVVVICLFVSVFSFVIVAALLGLSIGSAQADRAIDVQPDTFLWHWWKTWMAVVNSFVVGALGCGILATVYVFIPSASTFIATSAGPFDWLTVLVGLVAGPMATPIFLWMFHNSRLRPGFDRALNTEEASQR